MALASPDTDRRESRSLQAWFRARPRDAVVVAVVAYSVVFTWRLIDTESGEPISLWYVLPVALLATTFGLRIGLLASVIALGLTATWAVVNDVTLSAEGWTARVVPMLLIGAILGNASDRLRRAEANRRRVIRAAQRQRDAREINDTIVQGLTAAKWALESGEVQRGLDMVRHTQATAQALVSELFRDKVNPGSLRRSSPAAPGQ